MAYASNTHTQPRALLIDDEPHAARLLARILTDRFPLLEIESRTQPDPAGRFDLYFIDNDFDGERMAGALASRVRAENPTSLIVAFSGQLDAWTLKQLVNAGCNGACDKRDPQDVARLLEIVGVFLKARESAARDGRNTGLIGAIRSITDLIREWNQRLDLNRQVFMEAS